MRSASAVSALRMPLRMPMPAPLAVPTPLARAPPTMRLQYASDLHLEAANPPPFAALLTPIAPYLALCGDVGSLAQPQPLRAFLEHCAARFQRVFYVPGIHDRSSAVPALCAHLPNVHVLERGAVYLPEHNVAVLGAPRLSSSDQAWLDGALEAWRGRGAAVVVLTHTPPTPALIPLRDRRVDSVHADCSHLLRPPVRAWLCGHSNGGAVTLTAGGVLCSLNARGYPPVPGYCTRLFVDVTGPGAEEAARLEAEALDPLLCAAALE